MACCRARVEYQYCNISELATEDTFDTDPHTLTITCFIPYLDLVHPTALRGLWSGKPAVGLGVLRLRVLPRVQRSASRARSAHQVNSGRHVDYNSR